MKATGRSTMGRRIDAGSGIALGAGALIVAAAFLPWLTIAGDSRSGVSDGRLGWILVIAGIVACGTALTGRGGPVRVAWGLVAIVTMVVCLMGFEAARKYVEGVSVGVGPYVGLIGAGAAAIAALVKP
jgi:hypothetical protein